MRVLVQRVSRAAVRVRDAGGGGLRTVGEIGPGLALLVGLTHGDGEAEVEWMAEKVLGLRVFADGEGRMNHALGEVDGGALLVVSQFTLYGDASRGRRPSYVAAARPEEAEPMYEALVARLRAGGARVDTGEFGAMMEVELVNDGPVTLWLERAPGAVGA